MSGPGLDRRSLLFRAVDRPYSQGGYPFLNSVVRLLAYSMLFLYLLSNSLSLVFDPIISDESQRIWLSQRYFRLIQKRDFRNPFWQGYYQGFGKHNPKVTEYIMGLSLWTAGGLDQKFDGDQFNWDKDMEWNIRNNRTPPWEVLFHARLPMAFLEAGCGLLFLFLVSRVLGLLPGLLAALFFAGHPQMSYFGARALQDIPAMFFALLFLAVLAALCKRSIWEGRFWKSLLSMLLAGVILGVTLQTKMNYLVLIPVLALYFGWTALVDLKPEFKIAWGRALRPRNIILTAACLLAAFVTFMGTNPYLSAGPVSGAVSRINDIVSVNAMLSNIHDLFKDQALNGPADKVNAINHLLFNSYIYIKAPGLARFVDWGRWNIFYLLIAIGMAYALLAVRQGIRSGDSAGLDSLVLLIISSLLLFSVNFYWVPFRWTRYFLPFLIPIAVFVGFGIKGVIQLGAAAATRKNRGRALSE